MASFISHWFTGYARLYVGYSAIPDAAARDGRVPVRGIRCASGGRAGHLHRVPGPAHPRRNHAQFVLNLAKLFS